MKHLLTIHETDIIHENQNLDPTDFRQRHAARAVVLNNKNQVALLRANAYKYHKLPGGGVEDGEDMQLALKRELVEEIGCEAEVVADIGEIIEYRDQWRLRQTSHCYLARQVGAQRPPAFTQSEIDEGFEVVWTDNIDSAISLLEHDQPQNYDGLFIQRRDTTLLRAAKELL
jgi:ADP-ribose pyrophosphatase YjhB (NUDIX family)